MRNMAIDESTIIKLLHQQAAKLQGKVSAYGKYQDKSMFIVECRDILKIINELLDELEG